VQGIGRHTDYAARIVLHLAALGPGAQVQVGEIAQRRLLPPAFVRRVVARLASAGILRTTRGNGGGVRLARPAAQISMLDVVNAMEGGIVLNRCVTAPAACPLAATCPVQRVWADATRGVERHLAGISIAQLATAHETTISAEGYPGAGAAKRGPAAARRRRRT
jgi:Rrf2 family transcriptional regulator, iron-sulfur cluster assembly transcription factor